MKIRFWAFNTYLLLLAALMPGCQTDKKDKELSTLRIHIETIPMAQVATCRLLLDALTHSR